MLRRRARGALQGCSLRAGCASPSGGAVGAASPPQARTRWVARSPAATHSECSASCSPLSVKPSVRMPMGLSPMRMGTAERCRSPAHRSKSPRATAHGVHTRRQDPPGVPPALPVTTARRSACCAPPLSPGALQSPAHCLKARSARTCALHQLRPVRGRRRAAAGAPHQAVHLGAHEQVGGKRRAPQPLQPVHLQKVVWRAHQRHQQRRVERLVHHLHAARQEGRRAAALAWRGPRARPQVVCWCGALQASCRLVLGRTRRWNPSRSIVSCPWAQGCRLRAHLA